MDPISEAPPRQRGWFGRASSKRVVEALPLPPPTMEDTFPQENPESLQKAVIECLEEELEEKGKEMEALRALLTQEDEKVKEAARIAEKKQRKMKRRKEELKRELARAKEDSEEREREAERQRMELEERAARLEAAALERDQHQQRELDALREERNQVEAQRLRMEREAKDARAEHDTQQRESERLARELARAKEERAELAKMKQSVEEQLIKVVSDQEGTTEVHKATHDALQTLEQSKHILEAEIAHLKAEREEAVSERKAVEAAFKAKLERRQAKILRLRQDMGEREKEKERLADEIERVRSAKEEALKGMVQMDNKMRKEREDKEKEISGLKQKISALEEANIRLDDDKEELVIVMGEMEEKRRKEVADFAADVEREKRQYDKVVKEKSDVERELLRVRREREETIRAREEMRHELERAEERAFELEEQLAEAVAQREVSYVSPIAAADEAEATALEARQDELNQQHQQQQLEDEAREALVQELRRVTAEKEALEQECLRLRKQLKPQALSAAAAEATVVDTTPPATVAVAGEEHGGSELDTLRQEIAQLEAENAALKAERVKVKKETEEVLRANLSVVEKINDERKQMDVEREKARQEIAKAKEERQVMKRMKEEREEQMLRIIAEKEQIEREKQVLNEKLLAREGQPTEQGQVAVLPPDDAKQRDEREPAGEQLQQRWTQEIEALRAALDSREGEITLLVAQKQQLETENAALNEMRQADLRHLDSTKAQMLHDKAQVELQLQESQRVIGGLNGGVAQRGDVEQLASAHQRLLVENAELTKQVDEFRLALRDAATAKASIEEELRTAKAEVTELETARTAMAAQLEALQHRAEVAERSVTEGKQDLAAMVQQRDAARESDASSADDTRSLDLESYNKRLSDEVEQSKRKLREKDDDMAALGREMTRQLDHHRHIATELQGALLKVREEAADQVEALRRSNRELTDQLSRVRDGQGQTTASAEADRAHRMEAALRQATEAADTLKRDVARMAEERMHNEERIEKGREDIERLATELVDLRKERDQLAARAQEQLTVALASVRTENERDLAQERANSAAKLASVVEDMERERTELLATLAQLRLEKKELVNLQLTREAELARVIADKQTIEEDRTRLQRLLDEAQQPIPDNEETSPVDEVTKEHHNSTEDEEVARLLALVEEERSRRRTAEDERSVAVSRIEAFKRTQAERDQIECELRSQLTEQTQVEASLRSEVARLAGLVEVQQSLLHTADEERRAAVIGGRRGSTGGVRISGSIELERSQERQLQEKLGKQKSIQTSLRSEVARLSALLEEEHGRRCAAEEERDAAAARAQAAAAAAATAAAAPRGVTVTEDQERPRDQMEVEASLRNEVARLSGRVEEQQNLLHTADEERRAAVARVVMAERSLEERAELERELRSSLEDQANEQSSLRDEIARLSALIDEERRIRHAIEEQQRDATTTAESLKAEMAGERAIQVSLRAELARLSALAEEQRSLLLTAEEERKAAVTATTARRDERERGAHEVQEQLHEQAKVQASLRDDVARLAAQIDTERMLRQTAEDERDSAKAQVQELERSREERELLEHGLRASLAEQVDAQEALRREVARLTTLAEEERKLRLGAEHERSALEQSSESSSVSEQDLQARLEEQINVQASLRAEILQLTARVEDAESKSQAAQEELNAVVAARSAESEHAQSQVELQLRERLEEQQAVQASLRNEVAQLMAQLEDQRNIATRSAKLERAQAEKLEEQKSVEATLRGEVARLSGQLEEQESLRRAVEAQRESLASRIEAMEQRSPVIERELREALDQQADVQASLRSQVERLSALLEEEQRLVHAANQQRTAAEARARELERSLGERDQLDRELRETLDGQAHSQESLRAELERLTALVEESQGNLLRAVDERHSAMEELRRLHAARNEDQASQATLQSEVARLSALVEAEQRLRRAAEEQLQSEPGEAEQTRAEETAQLVMEHARAQAALAQTERRAVDAENRVRQMQVELADKDQQLVVALSHKLAAVEKSDLQPAQRSHEKSTEEEEQSEEPATTAVSLPEPSLVRSAETSVLPDDEWGDDWDNQAWNDQGSDDLDEVEAEDGGASAGDTTRDTEQLLKEIAALNARVAKAERQEAEERDRSKLQSEGERTQLSAVAGDSPSVGMDEAEEAELARLRRERKANEEALRDALQRIDREAEVNQLREEVEARQHDLRRELRKREELEERHREEKEALEDELNSAKAEMEAVQRNKDEEHERALAEMQRLRDEQAEVEQVKNFLDRQCELMASREDVHRERMEELQDALKNETAQVQLLQQRLDDLVRTGAATDELECQLSTKAGEVDRMREAAEAWAEKVRALEAMVAEKQGQVAQLQAEREDAIREREEAERERGFLERQLELVVMQQEMHRETDRLADVHLADTDRTATTQVEQGQGQERFIEQLRANEAELEALATQVHEQEAALKQLREEKEEVERERGFLERQLELVAMQQEMHRETDRLADLAPNAALAATAADSAATVDLSARIRELTEANEVKDGELTLLREEKQAVEREVEQLRQEKEEAAQQLRLVAMQQQEMHHRETERLANDDASASAGVAAAASEKEDEQRRDEHAHALASLAERVRELEEAKKQEEAAVARLQEEKEEIERERGFLERQLDLLAMQQEMHRETERLADAEQASTTAASTGSGTRSPTPAEPHSEDAQRVEVLSERVRILEEAEREREEHLTRLVGEKEDMARAKEEAERERGFLERQLELVAMQQEMHREAERLADVEQAATLTAQDDRVTALTEQLRVLADSTQKMELELKKLQQEREEAERERGFLERQLELVAMQQEMHRETDRLADVEQATAARGDSTEALTVRVRELEKESEDKAAEAERLRQEKEEVERERDFLERQLELVAMQQEMHRETERLADDDASAGVATATATAAKEDEQRRAEQTQALATLAERVRELEEAKKQEEAVVARLTEEKEEVERERGFLERQLDLLAMQQEMHRETDRLADLAPPNAAPQVSDSAAVVDSSARIRELAEANDAKDTELTLLREEKQAVEREVEQLRQEKEEAERRRETESLADVEQTTARDDSTEALTVRVRELEQASEDKVAEAERLRQEKEEVERERDFLERQLELVAMQQEMHRETDRLADNDASSSGVAAAAREDEQRREEQAHALTTLTKRVRELEEAKKQEEAAVARLQEEKEEIERERGFLERQLDLLAMQQEMHRETDRLADAEQTAAASVAVQEQSVEALTRRVRELEQASDDKTAEVERLRKEQEAEAERLREEKEEAERERDFLERQLDLLTMQQEMHDRLRGSNEAETNDELESKHTQHKQAHERLEARYAALLHEKETLLAELQTCREEIEALSRVAREREVAVHAADANELTNAQIHELQAQIRALEDVNHEKESALNQLGEEKEAVQREKEFLERQLELVAMQQEMHREKERLADQHAADAAAAAAEPGATSNELRSDNESELAVATLTERLRVLEDAEHALTRTNGQLEERIAALLEEKETVERERGFLERQLELVAMQQEMHREKDLLDVAAGQDERNAQQEQARLTARLQERIAELEASLKQAHELGEAHRKHDEELKQLREEKENVDRECGFLERQLELLTMQQEMHRETDRLADVEQAAASTIAEECRDNDQAQAMAERIRELEGANRDKTAEAEQLREEKEGIERERDFLERQLELVAMQQEMHRETDRLVDVHATDHDHDLSLGAESETSDTATLTALRSEKAALQADLDQTHHEMAALAERVKALVDTTKHDDELNALRQQIERLVEERNQAAAEREFFERQLEFISIREGMHQQRERLEEVARLHDDSFPESRRDGADGAEEEEKRLVQENQELRREQERLAEAMAALQKEKESVELVKDFLERQLENLAVLDAARRDHLDETTSAAVQLSSIAADHQDSDIGAMRDTIHRLERELEEARAAADDASAGSQADLAAELEKTKTRLSKLAKEKAVIEEGMLQMMDAKERAEEQRAVIEERLADVEQQLARVTAQAVVQSQTASTNAVVAPDLVDAIVAAQREQLAQLTAEKERLASERDDLQRALDEHEARVTALTARAQQLEAQLETQTGEHAADVARMRVAADSALVAARRSHDEAVAQLRARLENEWRAREQELVQVREGSENDAAGRLLEAVSQRQAIEAQLIDLRERLEAVDAQLAKTTTAKSAAESELNAAQQVWVETQRQLERAVDDAVARLKTSDEARSKLEHEVDRLEDEKSVFEEGLMKMMEGRGADESARKRLERKLAEALERVQQLEEAVAANQLELDQLRQSDTLSHPPAEAHAAPSTPERGEDVEEDHRATAERNTWREERAGLETQLERARQREIDATRERDELAKEAQRMIDDRVAEIEALRRQLEELSQRQQHHVAGSGDVVPGTEQEDDATKLRAITDSLEGVERAMIEDARQQKELEAELEAARQELREEKRLTRELKEALEHDRSTADQAHDDAEERSAKDARVTALVRECEELRRDNDDLRKELDEVKREGEVELRRALADMRREKEELQREIVNAMVRLEELDKEHKHALKSNDDAEQSVGSQGEAEEDKEAQTRIELERDHEREIRVALQDQLRDAATLRARDVLALEQIKCENDNLMDMLEATIVQRENLKTVVRELQLQSPSTIVRRLSQTDASDAAAATAGQERANDAAEVVQLRGEVERLQSEKMALEVAIVQARMNETERESQRRQDEAADAEEFEQLKRQVGELQADKQRLADRLAAALHQSRATGDDEVESTEQATTVAALRQQLAEQDQELQDLRQTLAQRSAEGEKDEDDDVPFELLVEEWERQETERELAERQRVEEQLEQLRRLLAAHEPAVEDLETRFTSAVSDVRTRLAQKQEELDELADVRQDEDADADTAPAAEGCDNEHAREADVRDVSDAERSEWLEEKRALLDQIDQLRTEVLQLQARVERAAQQDDERLQETLTLRDEIARSNTIVDELTKELEASRRRTSSPSRPPAASSRPKPTTPSPDPTLRRALVAREAQVIETVERRLASLSAKSTVSRGKLEMLRSDVAEARKALDRRVAATAGGRPQAGGGDEQLQFIESLEGIIGSLCDIVAAESGVPRAPSAADYQRDHDLDLAADDDFDFGDEAEAESREDRGGEDRRAALFLMRSKVEEMIQRMATAHLEGGVRSSSSSPMAASRHH